MCQITRAEECIKMKTLLHCLALAENPSMTISPTPTPQFKTIYDHEGYVIVPDLIDPSEFVLLKEASTRVIDKTRSGEWPHRRTVGKQFPPFNVDSPDSWGVQHVMHPDLESPEFVRWYTGDGLIGVVKELLGCSEDDLQMGTYCTFA